MKRVAIIGTGMVRVGKSEVPSYELFAQAALESITEAGIEPAEIQGLHLGNVLSAYTEHQTSLSPRALSALGLNKQIPCIRYETACASGSVAFRQGYINIVSGIYDVLLVGGTERKRSIDSGAMQEAMASAFDVTERKAGLTFAAYWAIVARAYAQKYGISEDKLQELLAHISVKNHYHGFFNPNAQFHKEFTNEDVFSSAVVSPPIKVLDSCPFSDGAAALVIASEEYVKSHGFKKVIWIAGSAQASEIAPIAEREELYWNPAIEKAAKEAYKQAKMSPKDIDFAEVHDCVNIHEVICIEEAGLFENGGGIFAAAEKKTYFDGEMPVNLSGGLKARGHADGATGAYQLCEVTRVLRGDFGGKMPTKEPNVGLTVNVGGTGTVVTTHILTKD